MEKKVVEGIILNETNYSETSKILNILTKEYGYISVISKGCRNLKSKLLGISMKLVYANFSITYKENGISTLLEGNVINSLKYIMNDFQKINFANYLLDLTKSVLKENNTASLFPILRDSLLKINDGYDVELITNIFEIKMLEYLGVKPDFSECLCGSKEVVTFDILKGAICKDCLNNTYIFLPNTIKLLKLFQVVDINKIDKLKIASSKVRKELEMFIEEYYETYTGIYLPNKNKFLKISV